MEKLLGKVRHNLLDLIEPLIGGFAANAGNPTRLEECRNMQIPTLLLFGEKSGAPERAMVEILAQNIPRCRVEPIPGARHQSPLSHPKTVAGLIRRHIAVN